MPSPDDRRGDDPPRRVTVSPRPAPGRAAAPAEPATRRRAVAALWLALTALARARRSGTARPRGSVIATVIAAVGIILSTVMLIAFAVLGKQLTAYGRCLSAASSASDQQACQNQFIHAVDREIAVLRRNGSG
jgi:hypothetical protein